MHYAEHEDHRRVQNGEDDVRLTHRNREEGEESAENNVTIAIPSVAEQRHGYGGSCVEQREAVRVVEEIGEEDGGNGHGLQHPQKGLLLLLCTNSNHEGKTLVGFSFSTMMRTATPVAIKNEKFIHRRDERVHTCSDSRWRRVFTPYRTLQYLQVAYLLNVYMAPAMYRPGKVVILGSQYVTFPIP